MFSVVRQTVINALAESATLSGAEIVTGSDGASAPAPDGDLDTGRRPQAEGRSGDRRRRRQFAGARQPGAARQAQVSGRRLHAAPDRQDAGGARAGQDGATTIEYWSGSRRVLYTPCSETEIYIALTMLDSDEVAKAMPVRRDAWKRWFPHLEALIDRLDDQGRYDRFELIKLKRWSSGRVAIIGDAAHALPPNIGQGGGCAMMNALSLAVHLDREHNIRAWR